MLSISHNRQVFARLLIAASVVAGVVGLGGLGAVARLPVLAITAAFFAAMSVAFIRGTEGLYLIIFAMLFSPEIPAGVATGRTGGEGGGGIVLRLEDVIMFAVVLGWMLRSAYRGRRLGIVKTPVNAAIWIYMATSIIATLFGVLRGSVRGFWAGFFHNLKYFEYFVLFFMILAHVRKREIITRMIWAMLLVFFLVMIYGYTRLAPGVRVSAPFDTEPNTFGGYIVLLMCIAAGIALADSRARVRVSMVCLLLFAIVPLLFTLSRASYLALIVAVLSFLSVSRRRILIGAVTAALVAATMLGLPILPERVQERAMGTFQAEGRYHVRIAGVDFDSSASARLLAYREATDVWLKSPLFGWGVTGTHFIDGQYPRLLAETGIVGLSAFLLIFWRLLRRVHMVFHGTQDPFLRGATQGFFCGAIAILAHGLSANSFIIVRIAEPFWLLAGLILLIPETEQPVPEATPGGPTPGENLRRPSDSGDT